MSTRPERIAYIRGILESGVSATTVDGIRTALDLNSLRRELRRLEDEEQLTNKRPRIVRMNIKPF